MTQPLASINISARPLPDVALTEPSLAPRVDTDDVLVAAQDIPMGTQITDVGRLATVAKAAISEFMIAKSAAPTRRPTSTAR